jgi:hypothetical protein
MLYPRGQPRTSDFAHAESAEHARLPTLRIGFERQLIPFLHQSELTIYGKEVMERTKLGLRSM